MSELEGRSMSFPNVQQKVPRRGTRCSHMPIPGSQGLGQGRVGGRVFRSSLGHVCTSSRVQGQHQLRPSHSVCESTAPSVLRGNLRDHHPNKENKRPQVTGICSRFLPCPLTSALQQNAAMSPGRKVAEFDLELPANSHSHTFL